jgi:hypothetical protein
MIIKGDGGKSGLESQKLFENETVQAFVQEMVLTTTPVRERY